MSVPAKLQIVTRRDDADWAAVRAEIVLWIAVPACLLAAWMYAFPTGSYNAAAGSIGFPNMWGVTNSWLSLLLPISVFCIALAVRLRGVPLRKRWYVLPITLGAALWWIGFAAAIKATALRLVYLSDVVGVHWNPM